MGLVRHPTVQQLRANTTLAEFLSSVPTTNMATTCNSCSVASTFGLRGHCTPDADPRRPCACCFRLCELIYALRSWFRGPCSSSLPINNLSRIFWAFRGRIWWRPPILTLSSNNVWLWICASILTYFLRKSLWWRLDKVLIIEYKSLSLGVILFVCLSGQ